MRITWLAALCCGALHGTAFACAPDDRGELRLTVTPGERAEPDSALLVQVHANGCLQIRRPAHWLRPGRYTASVDATLADWRSRSRSLDAQLAKLEPDALLAELAQADAARGEVFSVQDADCYALEWVASDGQWQRLGLPAVPQLAERHRGHDGLTELASLIDALQQQALRHDLSPQLEQQP